MCLVQIPESHSESLSVLHKNMFNFTERNKKRRVEIVKEINAAAATLWINIISDVCSSYHENPNNLDPLNPRKV